MTLANLERRLRKVEARRSGAGTFFAAWGRTEDEARQALREAERTGAVHPGDERETFVWPDPTPVPRSRWLRFGRASERELPDRELEVMHDTMEAEAVAGERADMIARGEDVSGLDATDLRIRIMRRESRDLIGDLRWLAIRENPHTETHTQPCGCDRCTSGETHPIESYHRQSAQRAAWLSRYLPGEALFP